jgi:hypothetical protein
MHEFVADQVLGISGLINLSNIVFLVAFSVRGDLRRQRKVLFSNALCVGLVTAGDGG